tara:strand:- start:61 stop:312 length:252 start_codon:yes stop_codon:yes gene_type:complete
MTHTTNRCKDIPWEFDSRKLDKHYVWMRKELYSRGITISGLAKLAGMDRAYVSKYLNGYHVNVTIGTIERLDDALSDLVRKER